MNLPIEVSLIRYHQLNDSLIALLREIAELARKREFTLVNDRWIEGLTPKYNLPKSFSASNKVELYSLVDEITFQAKKPFRVAVVGEFTRGKTTLLNGLLERHVLTSDRRPNTATLTTLRHGEKERIRIKYFEEDSSTPTDIETQDLRSDLSRYTSDASMDAEGYEMLLHQEEQSLAEKIEEVEVWLPSPFLKERGYEIVDTPGIGSIFDTHQSVTYNAIPKIDAVLFLSQFNALLGEEETMFLGSFREHLHRFLFVLTKSDLADTSDNPDKEIERALDFTKSVLSTHLQLSDVKVYPTSAAMAVQQNLYSKSGLVDLAQGLDRFIAYSKGKPRLLQLCRNVSTHSAWIQRDIQNELHDCQQRRNEINVAVTKLNSEVHEIELFNQSINVWLKSQIDQIASNLSSRISQLPQQLRSDIEVCVRQLNFSELKELEVILQSSIRKTFLRWIDEQHLLFIQEAGILQRSFDFFLSQAFEHKVKSNWVSSKNNLSPILPEIPSFDVLTEDNRIKITVASITGFAPLAQDSVIEKLLATQEVSGLTAYKKFVFNTGDHDNFEAQFNRCLENWSCDFNGYLGHQASKASDLYCSKVKNKIPALRQEQKILDKTLLSLQQQEGKLEDCMKRFHSIREEILKD